MSDIYYYHLKAYKDRLTLAIESPAEKNTKEILFSVSFFPEEKEIRIGCNLYFLIFQSLLSVLKKHA